MVNEINISTNTHNKKSVNVSAGTSKIDINLTKDLSAYYSMLAKDWAIKTNGTVDDIEYSAKYYADVAQRIAEQFGISKEEVIAALQTEGAIQIANIQEVAEPILAEVDKLEPISQNIDSVVDVAENIDDIINKTVDVGQTITSEPGTMASVENVGTIYAPVLDFTIPRGEKGDDGGMDATYDEETQTLSFYNETGTALHPQWGGIEGDITHQSDLQATLNMKANKDELDNKQDKGNYALKSEIPNISNLATKSEVTQGLGTKQDKGDYALKSDIPTNISAFNNDVAYVTGTDYASATKGGVVKFNSIYGNGVLGSGVVTTVKSTDDEIIAKSQKYRPIVPANLDLAVKTGITTNSYELTDDEKVSVKQWLGYATSTDIMQAIASIPQFNMSIVEELPLAGEKMTLYLVPKEGTNNDVYDEYIWIEQTTSFEHLGTTAVDLTDYVKKTDYASANTYGVVKVNTTGAYGIGMNDSAGLYLASATEQQVTAKTNSNKAITPLILDHAVKTGVTTNTIELTDDEKTSARTWLGAVGSTDYAQGDGAGLIKVSATYSTFSTNGFLRCLPKDLSAYGALNAYAFISKGTLDNVLTQYATNETVGEIDNILDQLNGGTSLLTTKAMAITEADYNALETKDANTLYLIEE